MDDPTGRRDLSKMPSGTQGRWPVVRKGPPVNVAYATTSRPHLTMNHIDGPLLCMRNGELHWLTLWERLRVALGLDDAMSLEKKHRPWLQNTIFD
ncbi:MAG: hypothetical protein KGL39_23840 [Patescibacteria group bacterium]|nr:hypothetical protein [Patescibacteria group bacterium]